MGLAASQARLLTITSRLSSVELKQQRIAMDKMRLANDQEGVSEKYTNALNNKTLTISNGGEEIAMNYSTLAAQGYSVMRASDGVIASSAGSSSAAGTSVNSSAKTNANSSAKANTNASNPEIQKWVGQPAPTRPTPPTTRLSQVLATKPTPETAVAYNTEPTQGIDNMLNTIDTGLNPKAHGITALFEILAAGLVNLVKLEKEEYPKLIETLQNAQQKAQKNGDNETAQKYAELVKKAQDSYNACQSKRKFKGKQLDNHLNARANELKSIKSEMDAIQNSLNNKVTTKNQAAQAEYDKKVAVAQAEENEYQQVLNQYNIDYTNWVTANSSNGVNDTQNAGQATGSNSGSTAGTTGATGTNATATTAAQELAAQMKNTQFLIQGLLSGYLVLVKDGQQVSLSSATDIIESYDKTDDAAAEAEYNAQMNKINRKEKILDMQAKRLDTEYSALTNEYNSIKTIIDNHTQKDFSYFS